MYGRKRDIGNSIIFFGLVLILLIGYHGWLKEDNSVEIATDPALVEASVSNTVSPTPPATVPMPPAFETPLPEVSAAEVVDPEPPASSQHADTLLKIRNLIQRQNDEESFELLVGLPSEVFLNPEHRQYVAVLWNNLGVLQAKLHGPDAALTSYITGLDLDPLSPALNLNLAHAYWEKQDPRLTKDFLEKLAKLVPQDPFPHIALADLLYAREELGGAARELEIASRLAESNPKLAGYLQMVKTKVTSANRSEQQLRMRHSEHFVVKFDGEKNYEIWDDALDILEDAYRDIGQKLGYFPSRPIHVVLMTRQQFQTAEGTPAWADALFDPVLGRIKVPTRGALTDRKWFANVLRHEYVHALIHERMGLQAGNVPTWLNEGLAMQLAGDEWPDIDQLAHGGSLRLIPLSILEGGWGRLPTEAATLAYLEANSATRYMIQRFGIGRVRDVLDLLKSRHTISGAIHDKLMMPYEVFETRWVQDLQDRMTARSSSKR